MEFVMDSSDMTSGSKQNKTKSAPVESKEPPKFLECARSQVRPDESWNTNHEILFNGEQGYQCFQNMKYFVLSHVRGNVSILQAI